jgi:hypothetical protein
MTNGSKLTEHDKVWSIDAYAQKFYNLVTLTGSTPYGKFQCVPVVMEQGTHRVLEWRIWTTLVSADNPDLVVHVGFIQIDPVSVPAAVRYRTRHLVENAWNAGAYYTMYNACLSLQIAEIVRTVPSDASTLL